MGVTSPFHLWVYCERSLFMAVKEDNYNNDEMKAEIAKILKEAKAEAKIKTKNQE